MPINNSIEKLKKKLNSKNLKISIIDNNIMGFLVKLKDEIDFNWLFDIYDLILIPKWVANEINDGNTRVDCLNKISTKKDVYIIDEKDFSYLVNYKDLELLQIFQASVFLMAEVKNQIKCYINKFKEEDFNYEDFIDYLYNDILKLSSGKRKNAGEISITALSYVLGYYYNEIDNITIFTFDKDCYDFIKNTKEILSKTDRFKNKICTSITFKSSDLIYKQIYDKNNDKGVKIINNTRKNLRYVKYTLMKIDGSIEERLDLLDNNKFKEMLKSKNIHLIF